MMNDSPPTILRFMGAWVVVLLIIAGVVGFEKLLSTL